MTDDEVCRRARVRTAIVRYLSKHPRASDAVVGICAWWLPREGVHESGELVQDELDTLVSQGRIEVTELADGTRIYGSARTGREPE